MTITIHEARSKRDDGMGRSSARAGSTWVTAALATIQRAIHERLLDEPFLGEEFRLIAYDRYHLPRPPDERAWGAVFNVAARRGLIERRGYRQAISSNLSPKPLWAIKGTP